MGIFDEMFNPAFVFDNESRQRRDIEALEAAVANAPTQARHDAPRCGHCNRHLNPQRTECICCAAAIGGAG